MIISYLQINYSLFTTNLLILEINHEMILMWL
jgi:hypothetical protein